MEQHTANRFTVIIAAFGLIVAITSLAISYETRQLAAAQFMHELESSIPNAELHTILMRDGKDSKLSFTLVNNGSPLTIIDMGFEIPAGDVYPETDNVYNAIRLDRYQDKLPIRIEKNDAWIGYLHHKEYRNLDRDD